MVSVVARSRSSGRVSGSSAHPAAIACTAARRTPPSLSVVARSRSSGRVSGSSAHPAAIACTAACRTPSWSSVVARSRSSGRVSGSSAQPAAIARTAACRTSPWCRWWRARAAAAGCRGRRPTRPRSPAPPPAARPSWSSVVARSRSQGRVPGSSAHPAAIARTAARRTPSSSSVVARSRSSGRVPGSSAQPAAIARTAACRTSPWLSVVARSRSQRQGAGVVGPPGRDRLHRRLPHDQLGWAAEARSWVGVLAGWPMRRRAAARATTLEIRSVGAGLGCGTSRGTGHGAGQVRPKRTAVAARSRRCQGEHPLGQGTGRLVVGPRGWRSPPAGR